MTYKYIFGVVEKKICQKYSFVLLKSILFKSNLMVDMVTHMEFRFYVGQVIQRKIINHSMNLYFIYLFVEMSALLGDMFLA